MYAEKHGVTKAAIRYHTNRQYIYRWRKRYDGTLKSLEDRSHRPRSHPNQHQPEEIKLIRDMRRRNSNAGLVIFWVKLRQRGYTRSISGLYRFLRRNGQMAVKLPNPKYIPKPYEQMSYPGQRVRCRKPLTQISTQNGKRVGGNSGESSAGKHLFLERICPESIKKPPPAPLTAAHNPKVVGSNPAPATKLKATFCSGFRTKCSFSITNPP